jgi:hypothetical protein
MDVKTLLAKMASQREVWVDLSGTRRLQYRRPPEVELPRLAGGVTLEVVVQYACGWSGFTEADLLGPAIGSNDEVPFSAELWEAYVRDHAGELQIAAKHMAETVTAYLLQRDAAAKNSAPSST